DDSVHGSGVWNSKFDDQARAMEPTVEGTASVVRRTAPGKVQLVETGALNRIKVPIGRADVRVAHVFIDQCEQQFFLCCIEIAGRQTFEAAQAVAPANPGEHVGEKGLGGYNSHPALLRMGRVDEIKTAYRFTT